MEIKDKAAELQREFRHGGVETIKKTITTDNILNYDQSFYIRISSQKDGTTVFSSIPENWDTFDFDQVKTRTPKEASFLTIKSPEVDYALEIFTIKLSDRFFLQIGSSTQMRETIRAQSFSTFTLVIIPSALIFLILVWYLSSSMLKPVSKILDVVRTVIQTDSYDQVIPHKKNSKEFDELVDLINTMFSRLDNYITNLTNTLETVAHDIRTPMTRIRTMAEVAVNQPEDTEEMKKTIYSIIQETDTVSTLLRLILDASEAESGSVKLEEKETDLIELCRDAAEVYEYIADEKDITIEVYSPETLKVYADPSRIQQTIGNLLDNAVKFTNENTVIRISVSLENGGVTVRVSDQGSGIASESIEKIWKPRFRSSVSQSSQGYGLGLPIVKAIIKSHGGSVGAHNLEEGGAEFFFFLPAERVL
ncbi:MAG: HAMP domain-containing histidine kinase [Spirochaetales bacterium]|nr:HAMP domain-containing histidine kinase [Spirochaetales bacterium]